jgi:hypothetical protein
MPPMSSLRTFISALKTGETRTTTALERVVAHRRGAVAAQLIADLHHRGALDAPLADPFRQAIKKTPLPERFIDRCIDGWPDPQKESARRALVAAINDGRRVQFRWGLTMGRGCETKITRTANRVTITALSPRNTLRIAGKEIHVAPSAPATKRSTG